MKVSGLALGFLVGLTVALAYGRHATAHHNSGRLPLIPDTPAVEQALTGGKLSYCFNSRAQSYPGFVAQVREVNAAFAAALGVSWHEVAFGPQCQVQHVMPEQHACSACAAWVYYASWPVVVEYKWQLAYVSWRSTIGHELGHVFGLHEAYDDLRGVSHILTYGTWASPWDGPTVMDVGTHVPFPPFGLIGPTDNDLRLLSGWLFPAVPVGGAYRHDLSAVFYGAVPATAAGFQPARYISVSTTNIFDETPRWLTNGRAYTAAGLYGVQVPPIPACHAVWISAVNALAATWGSPRVHVGQTPCHGVW